MEANNNLNQEQPMVIVRRMMAVLGPVLLTSQQIEIQDMPTLLMETLLNI